MIALLTGMLLLTACAGATPQEEKTERPMTGASAAGIIRAEEKNEDDFKNPTEATEAANEDDAADAKQTDDAETVTEDAHNDAAAEATTDAEQTQPVQATVVQLDGSGKVVCIDAGHQAHQNTGTEPIGPGSSTMKQKVSSGTQGVSTGIPEYQLTMTLAQKVQAILEAQGYTVIMCRTSNDVDLSNSERAQIANNAGANAFVRIHADGNNDSSVHGCTTLCQTASNPYNSAVYSSSRALASSVVNELAAATGAKNRGITETDNMSGINWSQVPVCIVEVGFMTNASEDQLMATEDYQNQIATGIANGIMKYLNQ